MTLRMIPADVNSVTAATDLAVSANTTFLQFTSSLINDTASNRITAGTKQAALLTRDVTAATLVSLDLDMAAEALVLHFNETMNVSSFNVGGIMLQVSSNANAAGGVQLTTSGAVSSTPGLDVTIALSLADLNAMKLKGVGSARSQSYLTMHMSSTVLSDMTGVAVNAIVNGVDAFSVSGILADGTSPVLSSFDLSINSSEAILRFSEVVKSSLFNASEFVLQRLNETVIDCPCSLCLDNEVVVSNCSQGSDTQCSRCTECDVGSYETRVCSSEQDAQCTQCETCATGTYLDAWCQRITAASCLSCTDSNCAECTGSGAMCTECPNSMVLLNCSCVGGCSPGMFTLSTASGDVRAPCDSSRGTCSGPAVTECISCPGSTVASGGSCVAVANCISGQYHTGSICADRDSSCATCFGGSSGSCISCNSSPVLPLLSGQTCVGTCLTGTYSNTGRCETCSHSCGSCSDAATCTVCTPPLQLEHGRCCRLSIAGANVSLRALNVST